MTDEDIKRAASDQINAGAEQAQMETGLWIGRIKWQDIKLIRSDSNEEDNQ